MQSSYPPGGFSPGRVYESIGMPTFETVPDPDWEALPDVVKWAHTLSTQTSLSFAEALDSILPLWDHERERAYRELQAIAEDREQLASSMEQLLSQQHARIEELTAQRTNQDEAIQTLMARDRRQSADLEVLHGIDEIVAAPFTPPLKSAHAKLRAIMAQLELLEKPTKIPGRDA